MIQKPQFRSENRTLLPAPTCLCPICVRSSEYCHARYASVNRESSATKRSFGSCPRRMTEQSSPASDDIRVSSSTSPVYIDPRKFFSLSFVARKCCSVDNFCARPPSSQSSAFTFEKSTMSRTTWPTTSSRHPTGPHTAFAHVTSA